MTDAQLISGGLNQNAYTIKSLKTGTLTLVIQSTGHLNNDVTVFFRQIPHPPQPQTKEYPLTVNKATRVYTTAYSTFTIAQPSVIAVNYTGGIYYYNPDTLHFFSYNTTSKTWNSITYWSNTVQGNLFIPGSYTMDSSKWVYVPSGTYAVQTSDPSSNLKYTINVVPITQMANTDSKAVDITNQSIYAFQPDAAYPNYEYLNLTSSTHDNVSVRYQYAIIGKYQEIFGTASTSGYVGNQLTPSGWIGSATNNTNRLSYLKTLKTYDPIFIVTPYLARNQSALPSTVYLDSYSTQLTVTTNPSSDSLLGSTKISNTAISSKTTLDLKDVGYSPSSQYVYYWVPLSVNSNNLYNVTVYSTGNFTYLSNNYLNLSVQSVLVRGGKYTNLNTNFNNRNLMNDTNDFSSQLILTQSGPTYLYLQILRNFDLNLGAYANGTITIQLTNINAKTLDFPDSFSQTSQTLTWNKTVSQYEVSDSKTLFKIEGKSGSTPGFEIVVAAIALVSLPIIKKFKNKKKFN